MKAHSPPTKQRNVRDYKENQKTSSLNDINPSPGQVYYNISDAKKLALKSDDNPETQQRTRLLEIGRLGGLILVDLRELLLQPVE